ncbi:MAG TPA: 50S ribosomal protein L4 [Syntrophorhabdaceae bacterium]|jgi:large subunit ribosomal protein L4|nr:50S ribosomal protein L4 [Syntrophorhabdaceae bacterium]MDI9560672.1 50S ribosomal protein L4 [Pseudomonadota bacterium]HOB69744.1 50S ribosomal protein L4 [Syntrophorhabdaceae bacterium]HOF58518.1 50S ribosomal protein L4 [Syntrophorhabdaceae bacterium]HOS06399.1 50S ribosomal protein L4 [Syntrophorhabdaceae bacterium]
MWRLSLEVYEMAIAELIDIKGEKIGEVEIKDEVFGVDVKTHLMYDVVKMQLAKRRSGTACTKTRKDVNASGAKPFRQKGTGRARQGSMRSPLQIGGGVVFGPHQRDYSFSVPKKVRRIALKSALTVRYTGYKMKILDKLVLDSISTKTFNGIVKALNLSKPLFVIDQKNEIIEKSARNIPYVKVLRSEGLNVYDIIRHEQLVFTLDALRKIEEVLAK